MLQPGMAGQATRNVSMWLFGSTVVVPCTVIWLKMMFEN